jgi:hypothetical protein
MKVQKKIRHCWLMPTILATWKSKTGGSHSRQPGKKLQRPHPSQQLGNVVCTCHPKLCWSLRSGGSRFQAIMGKKQKK